MARPGLRNHPKFLRLCYILNEPEPHVLGYLSLIWDVGYESGNPLIGDAIDVELAAKFPGERGALFKALLDTRFIDDLENSKYGIHDLFDHAPEYVLRRAKCEAEREKKGKHLSDVRREAGKKGASVRWSETNGKPMANEVLPSDTSAPNGKDGSHENGKPLANVNRLPSENGNLPFLDGNTLANVEPPSLHPAQPAPIEGSIPQTPSCSPPTQKEKKKRAPRVSKDEPPEFVAFYEAYPRKQARANALKAWMKLAPSPDLVATIMSALERQKRSERWIDPNYVPHPATWLNGHRWEDVLPSVEPGKCRVPTPAEMKEWG